jgi:hypothetical protein
MEASITPRGHLVEGGMMFNAQMFPVSAGDDMANEAQDNHGIDDHEDFPYRIGFIFHLVFCRVVGERIGGCSSLPIGGKLD